MTINYFRKSVSQFVATQNSKCFARGRKCVENCDTKPVKPYADDQSALQSFYCSDTPGRFILHFNELYTNECCYMSDVIRHAMLCQQMFIAPAVYRSSSTLPSRLPRIPMFIRVSPIVVQTDIPIPIVLNGEMTDTDTIRIVSTKHAIHRSPFITVHTHTALPG